MKTAVSLPDDLFQEADRLAKSRRKSRSEVYAAALREYLARHSSDHVTDSMDKVMQELGEALSPGEFATAAARRRLAANEW